MTPLFRLGLLLSSVAFPGLCSGDSSPSNVPSPAAYVPLTDEAGEATKETLQELKDRGQISPMEYRMRLQRLTTSNKITSGITAPAPASSALFGEVFRPRTNTIPASSARLLPATRQPNRPSFVSFFASSVPAGAPSVNVAEQIRRPVGAISGVETKTIAEF